VRNLLVGSLPSTSSTTGSTHRRSSAGLVARDVSIALFTSEDVGRALSFQRTRINEALLRCDAMSLVAGASLIRLSRYFVFGGEIRRSIMWSDGWLLSALPSGFPCARVVSGRFCGEKVLHRRGESGSMGGVLEVGKEVCARSEGKSAAYRTSSCGRDSISGLVQIAGSHHVVGSEIERP